MEILMQIVRIGKSNGNREVKKLIFDFVQVWRRRGGKVSCEGSPQCKHRHCQVQELAPKEDFHQMMPTLRFYTVDGLNPGVGYTVCFSTIYGEIEQGMEKAMEAGECREV